MSRATTTTIGTTLGSSIGTALADSIPEGNSKLEAWKKELRESSSLLSVLDLIKNPKTLAVLNGAVVYAVSHTSPHPLPTEMIALIATLSAIAVPALIKHSEVLIGEYLLKKFAFNGNFVGVKMALECGVDIECPNLNMILDLDFFDITKGLWEGAFSFFTAGPAKAEFPESWKKSWHNCTPLMLAAWQGHYSIVEYLAEQGGDLYHKSHSGNTALDYVEKPELRPSAAMELILKHVQGQVTRLKIWQNTMALMKLLIF